MARTRLNLTCSIWQDPDWQNLDGDSQRIYFLLLSQPKLTLAGCLDYMPARWASLSSDGTAERVEQAVAALVRARYVAVDYDTQELVIRTFVRHDVGESANRNTVKGMWSAWGAIMSAPLRRVVLEHVPETLWTDAPADAVTMRDTPPEPPSEPFVNDGPNDRPNDGHNDRSDDCSDDRANLPPSVLRPPLPSSASPASKPTVTHDPEARAKRACRAEADRRVTERIAAGEDIPHPVSLAKKIAGEDLWPVLGPTLIAAAKANPSEDIDLLGSIGGPSLTPGSNWRLPDLGDSPTAAAQDTVMARNHAHLEELADTEPAAPPADLASARAALRNREAV